MSPQLLPGVNIEHVATPRRVRGTRYPDPVQAALAGELAGAGRITAHLREERRHLRERDVRLLRELVQTKLILEMALIEGMRRLMREARA